jgi:hypothetical protein
MDQWEQERIQWDVLFGLRFGAGARSLERSRVRVRPVTLRRCFVLTRFQQMRRLEAPDAA